MLSEGFSEFIFLTFNLICSERQKYYIYVWYEIQSPKEMARVMSTEMNEKRMRNNEYDKQRNKDGPQRR